MSMFRVGIVGLLQESNTFIAGRTTLDHFREDLLLYGEDVRSRMAGSPHEVGGFFEGLEAHGIVAVPLFLARALPYGVIEPDTFDGLVGDMLSAISNGGHLDGILAAPHGATVAENRPDADGYWLSEVRKMVGSEIPIIATIDPHANLSEKMVHATDAIVAYATNPHLDQRETGLAAADLMARTLAGEIHPVQAAAFPPLAINIRSQNTSESPMVQLFERAESVRAKIDRIAIESGRRATDPVLSYSIVLGFPYADVAEMGSAAIVVTDDDRSHARSLADAIAGEMVHMRHLLEPDFISVEEAVSLAETITEAPAVLLDMGDNVGGGSGADSTFIISELHIRGIGPSFVCLFDPQAASTAMSRGLNSRLDSLSIGDSSRPLTSDFKVISVHDGRFGEPGVRHGGFAEFDQGPTAVLETIDGQVTVMVTSRRMPPFSLRQMTAFGVDPAKFQVIIAKGVIAPIAAYEGIAAGGFIHVDSPGVTRADMTKLSYRSRRRPMFPFEQIE